MSYLRFVLANKRFLAFGLLLAFLSGYGQTYLISLFGGQIREAFQLSNGEFGSIYSAATLTSGLSLIWLGRQIDAVDLRLYTALILGGALAGCLLLAGAQGVITLFLAFLLLRICGQGLMVHTAQTTMARYFEAGRGKAVSIATVGLPLGEAVLPFALVAAAAAYGWRQTWLGLGGVLVALVLPLALWLLRGHDQRVSAHLGRQQAARAGAASTERGWRRRDVLRDRSFYGVLPAVTAPPFIVTALFFHQVPLAAEKGWALELLAQSFVGFAAGHIASLFIAGPLVDRFGARRLLPFYLAPMGLGLLVLALTKATWSAPLYLTLIGLSMGVAGTLMGALWAELYGTTHLGAVRALVHSVMVLATAVAPALVGGLLDAGVAMSGTALAFMAWTLVASGLAGLTVRGASGR